MQSNSLTQLITKEHWSLHNRGDFEALIQTYFDTDQKHYGVILAVRRSPQEIAQRLLAILNQVTADEMESQVRYI